MASIMWPRLSAIWGLVSRMARIPAPTKGGALGNWCFWLFWKTDFLALLIHEKQKAPVGKHSSLWPVAHGRDSCYSYTFEHGLEGKSL